ncbi:MAG: hypothetical protein ACTHLR_11985 [Rhizomicrobium sp.]
MKRVLLHVAFFAVALGFTLFVFNFWGDFGRAMYNYLSVNTAPDKPSGVVTMKIIPPKPACDPEKQHCP